MNNQQFEQWCHTYNTGLLEKPLIMGILNSTPDSFYDGGFYNRPDTAIRHAQDLIAHGVDIIDIGGESTRPGALSVTCQEEMDRVIPLIEKLRAETDVCISIDTNKAQVMQAAIAAGAFFINDIHALRNEGAMAMAASLNVPVCLMHMQGQPKGMQDNPSYPTGIINEINQFFVERVEDCLQAGISHKNIILDPGFGFGKTVKNNLELVRQIDQFHLHNRPLMLGASRKSTLGILLEKPPNERLVGTLAITAYAALKNVAIIRTHDVDETNQCLTILEAINNEGVA